MSSTENAVLWIKAVPVQVQMPDVDTDVIIFDGPGSVGQLGACIAHDGVDAIWVDAQGQSVQGVTHWAEWPRLPG